MTRIQALAKAKTLWGKNAAVEEKKHALPAEQREQKRLEMLVAKDRVMAIDAEIKERLAATDWYVALQAERKEVQKRREIAGGYAHMERYCVGRIDLGMFFSILGSGDTWEEAFKKAEKA